MRTMKIKRSIVFDERNIFGYITTEPKQKISGDKMKESFKIVDVFKNEYEVYLQTIVRIGKTIPEVISFHAEGTSPERAKDIISKRGVDVNQPLAYLIFKKK